MQDAAQALASGRLQPGVIGIGMNDPEAPPTLFQLLRDEAARCLNDAAQCDDPVRRDGMLRRALALLNEARTLRDQMEDRPRMPGGRAAGAGPSTTGLQ